MPAAPTAPTAPTAAAATSSRLSALSALPPSTFHAKFFPPPHSDTDDSLSLSFTSTSTLPAPHPSDQQQRQNPPFRLRLRLRPSEQLSRAEMAACFDLVRETSAADYRASAQGWCPGRKRREMRLGGLWYLLVVVAGGRDAVSGGCGGGGDEEGEEVGVEGFLSFMLTVEDGVEVVYCYEIHLGERVRGEGVGRRLMGLLEEVGRRARVGKAMLTVFRRNERAVGFYEGLGYGVDEFSPRARKLRGGVVKEVDYLIMSKELGGGVGDRGEEGQRKRKAE